MIMQITEETRKCPFCGEGTAELQVEFNGYRTICVHAICSRCGASSGGSVVVLNDEEARDINEAKKRAIGNWNMKPTT